MEFLQFANSDGVSLNGLFAKSDEKFKWDVRNGFSCNNYRSLVNDENRLSLSDDLTTERVKIEESQLKFDGLSKKKGQFCGQMNLLFAFQNYLKGGWDEVEKLLNNSILVFVDPGVINLLSIQVFTGRVIVKNGKKKISGKCFSKIFKSSNRYNNTELSKDQRELKHPSDPTNMPSFKSSNPEEILQACETFKTTSIPFIEESKKKENKQQRRKRFAQQQSYYHSIGNEILCLVDAIVVDEYNASGEKRLVGKTPIIIFGDGKFRSGGFGYRSSPYVKIRNFLSRFLPVIMVDEYRTSMTCPKCQGILKDKDSRHKVIIFFFILPIFFFFFFSLVKVVVLLKDLLFSIEIDRPRSTLCKSFLS